MPVKNPAKQATKGRMTPLTPNQVPTTARGIRRSQGTSEYAKNVETRNRQSYPPSRAQTNPPKIPFKGPSKRPKGIDNKRWEKYMGGGSETL